MTLKICFELTDRDLQFFRKALRQSREAVKDAEDSEIVEAIHSALDEIRSSEPLPDFVGKRIPELESLISMLTDEEWQLPEADRERLLATFVYFADPEDILPDCTWMMSSLSNSLRVNSRTCVKLMKISACSGMISTRRRGVRSTR
jgi:hypothetical protein